MSKAVQSEFHIFWRYTITSSQKEAFEKVYQNNGVWAAFFSQSPAYIGSFLYQHNEEKNEYLLMDSWTDESSYERFITENKTRYSELSDQCRSCYEKEENLGRYVTIK